MSNYRHNALSPKSFGIFFNIMEVKRVVIITCSVDFSVLTREEYNSWVASWKQIYASIVSAIKESKTSPDLLFSGGVKHTVIGKELIVLANTLLNAREYAKNVRRAISQSEATPERIVH